MTNPEGKAQVKISVYGDDRELFCRVKWPQVFKAAERESLLNALVGELDRLMREKDESERDITKSG